MARNVIYYPFMSVPSYDWVKQALLLNDKIGFISPDLQKHGTLDDRLTDFLYRANFIEEIKPSEELDMEFSNKFLTALDQDLIKKNFVPAKYLNNFEIWGGKFTNGIQEFFIDNKLIVEVEPNLYKINEYVGTSYISAVAHELLRLNKFKDYTLFSNSTKSLTNNSEMLKSQAAEFEVLQFLLPMPKTDSFEEIVRFKEDNIKYRDRFLDHVNKELNYIEQKGEVNREQLNRLKKDLDETLADYTEGLKSKFGIKNLTKKASFQIIPASLGFVGANPYAASGIAVVGIASMIDSYVDEIKAMRADSFYYISKVNSKLRAKK